MSADSGIRGRSGQCCPLLRRQPAAPPFRNLSFCETSTYVVTNDRGEVPMAQMARLQEERRSSRRAIADVLEVVHQVFGLKETLRGEVRVGPLRLPSGEWTALKASQETDHSSRGEITGAG
jgi:hypothetical protein